MSDNRDFAQQANSAGYRKNIFDRQKEYTLKRVNCIPAEDLPEADEGELMYITIERPWLLLDTVIMRREGDDTSDSGYTQGIQNDLVFLQNHPLVQLLAVASVRSFHNPPGKFFIPDMRSKTDPVLKDAQIQYAFVLTCNDF